MTIDYERPCEHLVRLRRELHEAEDEARDANNELNKAENRIAELEAEVEWLRRRRRHTHRQSTVACRSPRVWAVPGSCHAALHNPPRLDFKP